MKFWLWTFLWTVCCLAGQAAELTTLLEGGNIVWGQSPAQFMAQPAGKTFHWTSDKKDTARAARGALTFADLPVWEALAKFEGNALKELTVSLYNRGDAGELGEAEFGKIINDADQALTKWSGAKGVALRDQERSAMVSISKTAWVKEPHRLDLMWTFTPKHGTQSFRPEFVRLTISKFDPANAPRAGFRETTASAGGKKILTVLDIRARVQRAPAGDVAIAGMPMVDQGQKGYCAAAVMERVLRYFGRDVDQHEIAQMANTATKGGTSMQGMLSALRGMAGELGCEVVTHEEFRVNDFDKLLADYNRAAQNKRRSPLQIPRTGAIDLAGVYSAMDADLLREARVKRDSGMQQFKATIGKYVNNGCPLVWGVMVGKVEEKPAINGRGGHLRMIIGWNEQKKEVLYTDTWGAGHELKRMSLADAWTITLALYTVEPRNMRF